MSNKTALTLAVLLCMAPTAAFAQFGIGVRAGTNGLGGEASIGIGSTIAVRGGIGFLPFETNQEFSGNEYTVKAPKSIMNVGVDLNLGGLRLSGGVMKREKIDLAATFTGTYELGGTTHTETANITGDIDNDGLGPYGTIGFGRTVGRGVGLYFDIGAAMLPEATIRLTSDYQGQGAAQYNADLQREADDAFEDLPQWAKKIHPILQFGLRVGL